MLSHLLKRLRQKDLECEASLENLVISCIKIKNNNFKRLSEVSSVAESFSTMFQALSFIHSIRVEEMTEIGR